MGKGRTQLKLQERPASSRTYARICIQPIRASERELLLEFLATLWNRRLNAEVEGAA